MPYDGANNKDCGGNVTNTNNIVSISGGNLILDATKINSGSAFGLLVFFGLLGLKDSYGSKRIN